MEARKVPTMRLCSMIWAPLVLLILASHSLGFDIIFPEKGCLEIPKRRTMGPTVPLSAPQPKRIGESCKITTECEEGLGCLQQDHVETCQWLPLFGENCSPYQIKGGVYKENGPCLNGDGILRTT
ncbi:uncharacterized protein LOC142764879 isoform X2 [Rhipicephalus microplus]|uniref:uncharacterized protein LOC142764879 isoform X2 n=1 Tax=Rhipicephalus microplus TaxID=6941 RepID=UPI003F6A6CD2